MLSNISLYIWNLFRRRQWHPTPVLLPGKSHGRRSLVGCSPWGREKSDTNEWLHFHFSLSCIGEGNSNPVQCSCLENPRDGGAWWAAIYGVAQSRTRLKRLSSSGSNFFIHSYRLCPCPDYCQCCYGEYWDTCVLFSYGLKYLHEIINCIFFTDNPKTYFYNNSCYYVSSILLNSLYKTFRKLRS